MIDVPSEENLDAINSLVDKFNNIDLKEVKFEGSEDNEIQSNVSLPMG